MIHSLLPWWVAGPLIGACVVALYAVANKHLGVSGGYRQIVQVATGRRPSEPWRLWFLGGLVAGGAVAAALFGSRQPGLGYGALGDRLNLAALVALLVAGGTAVGYGSCRARGCTSGNGIAGCSTRSPGSFVATGTFVLSAVAVTGAIRLLSGGAL